MHRRMGLKDTIGLGHRLWGLGLTDARFIGRCMAGPFDSRLCWVLKSLILAVHSHSAPDPQKAEPDCKPMPLRPNRMPRLLRSALDKQALVRGVGSWRGQSCQARGPPGMSRARWKPTG